METVKKDETTKDEKLEKLFVKDTDLFKTEEEKRELLEQKNQRLKIDIDKQFLKHLKYKEKKNVLKMKKFSDDNDDAGIICACTAISKRLTKKNCDTDENKFSIKILKTKNGIIRLGLRRLVYDKDTPNARFYLLGLETTVNPKYYLEMTYPHDRVRKGDIISLIYNSKKGVFKLKKNKEFMFISFEGLNIKEDYKFVITLYNEGDKIKIIE